MALTASEHINEPEIGPSKIGPSIKNTHVGFSGRVIIVSRVLIFEYSTILEASRLVFLVF